MTFYFISQNEHLLQYNQTNKIWMEQENHLRTFLLDKTKIKVNIDGYLNITSDENGKRNSI